MYLSHTLKWNTNKKIALALGTFDGLHLGHQAVLRGAADSGFLPAALTFDAHPRRYLEQSAPPMLMTREDKIALLDALSIQAAFFLDFASIRDLPPAGFLDKVCAALPVALFSCGYNFRFGKNGAGDAAFLQRYAGERNIEVYAAPAVEIDGGPVSSTVIRQRLLDGDMDAAARLLGRPFSFSLEVVLGDQRGRTIGFPTINQILPDGLILPKFGVYASRTHIDGKVFPSVTNVGVRPTFLADRALSETHIIDYADQLYGRILKVELLHFLRGETKFDSLAALKNAISKDLYASLHYGNV